MQRMRVLVACEYSGRVRDAFLAKGHDAVSCDLEETESSGPHYKGSVLDILGDGWDLMVAHPPCTYLCSMGVWWNHKRPERWEKTKEGFIFADLLAKANIPKIAIENPIGYLNKNWDLFPKGPSQIINPWQFGDSAHKPTCLWLKNLPLLVSTNVVDRGEFYLKKNGSKVAKWSHKISGASPERAKNASRTFQGIADAMADQWG